MKRSTFSVSDAWFGGKVNPFELYETEYDAKLAARVVNARLSRGLTQEQLAKKMRTKQPAIARAENGSLPASHKFLKKIMRVLGLKIEPPSFVPITAGVFGDVSFNVSGDIVIGMKASNSHGSCDAITGARPILTPFVVSMLNQTNV